VAWRLWKRARWGGASDKQEDARGPSAPGRMRRAHAGLCKTARCTEAWSALRAGQVLSGFVTTVSVVTCSLPPRYMFSSPKKHVLMLNGIVHVR
jgi:hypothetical protein